jgi:molybdenum-dependent DNA-binding transcriptional regulator ModE
MTLPRRRTFGFWTPTRRIELLKLIEQKTSQSKCAALLGTTVDGVANVLRRMRKAGGEVPVTHPKGNNHRNAAISRKQAVAMQARIDRLHQPQPETLTAWFCGDPLPGRSALDRKRLGIADEVVVESQSGIRSNRITLPMEPIRC